MRKKNNRKEVKRCGSQNEKPKLIIKETSVNRAKSQDIISVKKDTGVHSMSICKAPNNSVSLEKSTILKTESSLNTELKVKMIGI